MIENWINWCSDTSRNKRKNKISTRMKKQSVFVGVLEHWTHNQIYEYIFIFLKTIIRRRKLWRKELIELNKFPCVNYWVFLLLLLLVLFCSAQYIHTKFVVLCVLITLENWTYDNAVIWNYISDFFWSNSIWALRSC